MKPDIARSRWVTAARRRKETRPTLDRTATLMSKRKQPSTKQTPQKSPEILDVEDVARMLGVSVEVAYGLFRERAIGGRKIGRRWMTTKAMLLKYVSGNGNGSTTSSEPSTTTDQYVEALQKSDPKNRAALFRQGQFTIRAGHGD